MRNGPNRFGLDKGKRFRKAINGRNFEYEELILGIAPLFLKNRKILTRIRFHAYI